MLKKIKNQKGVTIIEALAVLFIFSVISISFYSTYSSGLYHILEAKNRLSGSALATEKLEIIRNMEYADVGTETGIPQGELPEREVVTKSGRTFYVFTFIQYVDDVLDGVEDGTPDDVIPNDYKRIWVKAAWEDNINTSRAVTAVASISPRGIESDAGGGTLSINVLNNEGLGIPQAQVRIYNAATGVNITALTDNTGNIMLPGAPAGDKNYSLTVTKSGYYSVQTYPAYPSSSFNPTDVHATCSPGWLNIKSIKTDKLSDIIINTEDPFGSLVPDVDFTLEGGKKIGDTLTYPSESVYDYTASFDSGSDGRESINDRSYGLYIFEPSIATHEFLKLDVGGQNKKEFDLLPDTTLEVKAIFADKSLNSILVRALNVDGTSPVEGAEVNLKNEVLSFDTTGTTDKYGQVYFPEALPELVAGDYHLTISATGYQDHEEDITVNDFQTKEINLSPSS